MTKSPFRIHPGETLGGKWEVLSHLGTGWEGTVLRVREKGTGAERAAKLFNPDRNKRNTSANFYARKLHKLRECDIVIHYHTREVMEVDGQQITCLISEYVEGELLDKFIRRQHGGRLRAFEGLHLLHTLARGLEDIHQNREYHGDLHAQNVIIRRRGIGFEVKLVDFFNWGKCTSEHIREDVWDLIKLFYDALGGAKWYARQRPAVKNIVKGLKRGLISKAFPNARALRLHIESMKWE